MSSNYYDGEESHLPVQFTDSYQQDLIDSAEVDRLLSDERVYRANNAHLGMIDIYLCAAGLVSTTISAAVQTELAHNPQEKAALHGSLDPFILMSEVPFEWKGITLALGAFAVTNAAARIKKYYRMTKDSCVAIEQLLSAESFTPATPKQTKLRRVGQRLGRGAVTAASCYGAYKAGEHLPPLLDLWGSAVLIAAATGSVHVAKYQAKQFLAHLLRRDDPSLPEMI